MNKLTVRKLLANLFLASSLLLCYANVALAQDAPSDWRSTYDVVMLWVNFGILFFIIFKFLRRPLMNFLMGQKEAIQKDLDQVQEEKEEMVAKGQEAVAALEESKERFEQIKARIIEQGQRRKDELIGEAEHQSQLMIESARHKIDYQIHRAKEKMRIELLDMAVDRAVTELPGEITPEDSERLVNRYLAAAISHA